MIDAIEELGDVQLEAVPAVVVRFAPNFTHPAEQSHGCGQRSLVVPATEGIFNEALVYPRVELPVERPLHHAVAEAQRHDKARLRNIDIELMIRADAVCAVEQVAAQIGEVALKIAREFKNLRSAAFALDRGAVCEHEVFLAA